MWISSRRAGSDGARTTTPWVVIALATMLRYHHRMRRAHVVVIGVAGLALAGCEEDKGGGKVLDSVVSATDQVIGAIENDPDTWLTEAEYGDDVAGTVEGGGGSITVSGWRTTTEYVPE